MNWASNAIEKLKSGEKISIKPRGNSMSGKIESGQEVWLRPYTFNEILNIGEIVLVKVKGKIYLHLIKAVKNSDKLRFQIGNNKGRINGWVGPNSIYGVVFKIGE